MPTTTTHNITPKERRDRHTYINNDFGKKRKLVTFNSNGAIYFPKLIREIFKGYYFTIEVSEGRIILDPVRIEDFKEVITGE